MIACVRSLLLILAIAVTSRCEASGELPTPPPPPTPVLAKADTIVTTLDLFIGGAFPSSEATQGPNAGGLTLSTRQWKDLSLGIDLSFSGTSQKVESGQTLKMLSTLIGIPVSYHPLDWIDLTLQPTLHRQSYTIGHTLSEEKPLATKYEVKLGFGVGIRLGRFLIDSRAFPSLGKTKLAEGMESDPTIFQVRVGYGIPF